MHEFPVYAPEQHSIQAAIRVSDMLSKAWNTIPNKQAERRNGLEILHVCDQRRFCVCVQLAPGEHHCGDWPITTGVVVGVATGTCVTDIEQLNARKGP